MVTEANWKSWSPQGLAAYFEVVIEAFSPRRMMFGSDWPVLTLASEYGAWVETVRLAMEQLSADEQARIWCETAMAAYRLEGCRGELADHKGDSLDQDPGR